MNRLEGKVALVTGAASGIGEASASFMGSEGASVVIADINLDGAEIVAQTIRRKGGNATAVFADMGDEQSSRNAAVRDDRATTRTTTIRTCSTRCFTRLSRRQ